MHSSEQIPGNFNSGWLQAVPGLLWIDSREISFHLSSLLDPDKMDELANLNTNERKLDHQPERQKKMWEKEEGKDWMARDQ